MKSSRKKQGVRENLQEKTKDIKVQKITVR